MVDTLYLLRYATNEMNKCKRGKERKKERKGNKREKDQTHLGDVNVSLWIPKLISSHY